MRSIWTRSRTWISGLPIGLWVSELSAPPAGARKAACIDHLLLTRVAKHRSTCKMKSPATESETTSGTVTYSVTDKRVTEGKMGGSGNPLTFGMQVQC